MREVLQGDKEAIAAVVAFLCYAEREHGPNMMYGSRRVSEAIEAMAHLIGCKPNDLRGIVKSRGDT